MQSSRRSEGKGSAETGFPKLVGKANKGGLHDVSETRQACICIDVVCKLTPLGMHDVVHVETHQKAAYPDATRRAQYRVSTTHAVLAPRQLCVINRAPEPHGQEERP